MDHVPFETTQAPKEAERGHLPYRSYSVPLLGPGTPEILSWMGLDFIHSPWTHGKMATGLSENTQENSDSSSCSPLKYTKIINLICLGVYWWYCLVTSGLSIPFPIASPDIPNALSPMYPPKVQRRQWWIFRCHWLIEGRVFKVKAGLNVAVEKLRLVDDFPSIYPLVNVYIAMEHHHFFMGKSTKFLWPSIP